MANVQEILNAICGKQENSNLPKCMTEVFTGLYLEKEDDLKELQKKDTLKPVITLERHDEFVTCDIEFISAFDEDLREINNIITLYGSNLNDVSVGNYEDGERRAPYFIVKLTALHGYDHVVTLTNPIFWALTSNKPGTTPNVIRALFKVDDVFFYEGELLDEADKILEEADKRALHEDMNSSFYAQAEEKRQKQLAEREETREKYAQDNTPLRTLHDNNDVE